jgi:imidazolonepropionase
MGFDSLLLDCHLATMAGDGAYGEIRDGALGVRDGRIAWLGPASELTQDALENSAQVLRLNGVWVTPGLIDCHTHLVYADSRAGEFEMRLNGASYAEIARAGGGILNTVKAVREASPDELYVQSLKRARQMMLFGVTTLEIKSGYGLDLDNELKMLRVARRLGESLALKVCPTFLGAHALPPEYRDRPDDYISLVCSEMIPRIAELGLADTVDAFCEHIAFSREQTRRVFEAARAKGLKVKLHAEQLSDQKGAILAIEFGALSCDHLEYIGRDGIEALAGAKTVAVLLPGAFYFLGETQKPPVRALRDAGVPIAISTDCNPGSSPCTSPLLIMNMACVLFGLTPAEALAGFTSNAAKALGLQDELGTLEVGKKADMAIWDITAPAELSYGMGHNPCQMALKHGVVRG